MKERPILFSAPMVRALLAGIKTQTRRVVKPQPQPNGGVGLQPLEPYCTSRGDWNWVLAATGHGTGDPFPCPYGQPGDRLRVKEAAWMWCERRPNGTTKTGRQKWLYVPMRAAGIWYAADHRTKPNISVVSPDTGNEWGWRLKIGRFLPGWASRITLEVTGVRVERLQDISIEDCKSEGAWGPDKSIVDKVAQHFGIDILAANPYLAYRMLWESINGPGSWEANPWVWVVEFKRLKGGEA